MMAFKLLEPLRAETWPPGFAGASHALAFHRSHSSSGRARPRPFSWQQRHRGLTLGGFACLPCRSRCASSS